MPMKSCMAPKAKWKVPANTPSACGDSPKSACSGAAMMATTVRKAELNAKPEVSATSISRAARGAMAMGAGGSGAAEGALGMGPEATPDAARVQARAHRPALTWP